MQNVSPAISGCKISMIEFEGQRAVKKWTEEKSYRERIVQQAFKQLFFYEKSLQFSRRAIRIPQVYEIYGNGFVMEYIPYDGYIAAVENYKPEEIRFCLESVVGYIGDLFASSGKSVFPSEDLVEKEISKPNFPKEYSWVGDYIKQKSFAIPLPNALCHGDLTMSNVLFSRNQVAFIDFNDVPVESSIIDIIKLRQDARFHWTTFMEKRPHDRKKVLLVDDFLRSELDKLLLHLGISIRECKYWEALNYLKIFRNAKEERVCKYLVDNIKEILE